MSLPSLPPETPNVSPETSGVTETPVAPAKPGRPLWFTFAREIIETALLTILLYVLINATLGRFRVEGQSMEPNFHENEYVLVDKISYQLWSPQRGDVVVFNYPRATEKDFIKRVIGLPGETVEVREGKVYINGTPLAEAYLNFPTNYGGLWTLGPTEYFMMGDNRNNSSDSRAWGPLEKHYMVGRVIAIYWPFTMLGLVPRVSYAATP